MNHRIISTVTLSLLCPLLALACDPEQGPQPESQDDGEDALTPRSSQVPAACQSLTPAALQASVDKIDVATTEIEDYLATTPQSNYPGLGSNAQSALGLARSKVTSHQAYLVSINHGDPYVSWEGAAQLTFESTFDAAHLLHEATWWAYLAMGYDKKEVARQSAKHASEAQQLASDLERQALLCAMERHFNCGDGVIDGGEACDDGNLVDGDGCDGTCQLDAGTCGDGVVDGGEECDDGNDLDNDGCDRCAAATPWPLDPEDPWTALTPAAVQRSVDLVDGSIAQIEAYIAETPQSAYYPNAGYNVAGTLALGYLQQARTTITAHQAYLTSNGYGAPNITSESVAQNHYLAMRDAADALYHGMWWSYLGAGYDHKHKARMAAQEAVAAQRHVDWLARQALRSAMSRYALCSDGVVNGTEQCDDGNLVAGDGCSSTCTTESVCGDGVVAGDEECDDGDLQNGDGCEDTCTETVSGGKIFLTQGYQIYQFNIGTNSWAPTTIAAPSITPSFATLTNDGRYVYRILDANDTIDPNDTGHPIDRLDTTNNTWEQNWMAGPPTQAACAYSRRDHFAWVGDGFYLVDNYCVYNGGTTDYAKIWRKNVGDPDWTLVTSFSGNTTGHGTWDIDNDKFYSYARYAGGWHHYDVVDTASDALGAGHADDFEYSRAFSRGGFYAPAKGQDNVWRLYFEKLNPNDTVQQVTSTGKTFTPDPSAAWGVDPATGIIYVYGNFYMDNMGPGLRSYDPQTNVLTGPIPTPGGGYAASSNLTVLRPVAE